MNNIMKIALFSIFVVALGCSGDDDKKEKDMSEDMSDITDRGGSSSVPDVVEDVVQPNLCPREGELLCDGKCVNAQISMDHCGACFNACIVGRMTCDGTACVCLAGKDLCNNDCWDLQITKAHCGTCGNACEDSQACIEGGCVEISSRPEVVGVLAETNIGRGKQQDCGVHGLKNAVGIVQLNDQLILAAQKHSDDMAMNNFMEHVSKTDGSTPGERARDKGYAGSSIGENIARGARTPEATVQAWIDSDGHCQNMMNGGYTELGVGFAISPMTGEFFWTQLFGRP